jgi:TRAP-type C4-dicarboxylate transport system substrate-binding protein
MGAEQLQWASRITDICTETVTFVIGAVLASSARLASLPANLRQIIVTRGAESADRLTKTIRNQDALAWARLKSTKHTYDLTDAERQEWRTVFVKVAKELRGSVFTPAVFDKIVQLSGNPLAN